MLADPLEEADEERSVTAVQVTESFRPIRPGSRAEHSLDSCHHEGCGHLVGQNAELRLEKRRPHDVRDVPTEDPRQPVGRCDVLVACRIPDTGGVHHPEPEAELLPEREGCEGQELAMVRHREEAVLPEKSHTCGEPHQVAVETELLDERYEVSVAQSDHMVVLVPDEGTVVEPRGKAAGLDARLVDQHTVAGARKAKRERQAENSTTYYSDTHTAHQSSTHVSRGSPTGTHAAIPCRRMRWISRRRSLQRSGCSGWPSKRPHRAHRCDTDRTAQESP